MRAELERVAAIEDRRERGSALGRLRPALDWLRPSPQTLAALAAVLALVAVVLAVAGEPDLERPATPPPQPNPTTAPSVPQDTPPAYLATLPARKSCGHFRIAPPGDYPLILVEVVKGNVPCRVARRVLKTQYRNVSPKRAATAAAPWRCSGPESYVVCHTDPGFRHNLIRARFS
ncbi:MAG TPA: hypothetical protein VFZ00_31870 [Solirubrobacter sp.]|nr:hypothetical protein [Solirubrobacter sp.]